MRSIYILIAMVLLAPVSVHAEHNDLHAEADRPGFGTGTNVLPFGHIQWETGFEVNHIPGSHLLTLPTTLFRFGLHDRAELRVEYSGDMYIADKPDSDPITPDEGLYVPEPLNIGTKIKIWGGSQDPKLKWIPRTSLMLNIGVPLTKQVANIMPISGYADLLFENDITEWLTIEYEFGTHWREWAPMPDFFASVGLDFDIHEKVGFFIENFNYFDCDLDASVIGYSKAYDVNLDFGITYQPIPIIQLDLYAGFNCYATEPLISGPRNHSLLGLGVTWLLYAPKN